MTGEEMAAMQMRLDAAKKASDQIDELNSRIQCVEEDHAGFRFCGGGGRWLGDSPELRNVILTELRRQVTDLEQKFSAL